jgi:transcriptional regulator with XRE-family HTH domain
MSRRFQHGVAILLPIQCKMARTALEIGVKQLAELAEVSTNTIVRFERGEDLKPRTISAIRTALQGAGVVFIEGVYAGDGGPGIRLEAPRNEETPRRK